MSATNNYKTMTTADLWKGLDKALSNVAREIVKLAAIAHELKDRGERVEHRLPSTYALLEDVYVGQLDPDVLAVFIGNIEICRIISASLVREEQAKLLQAHTILEVLIRDADGERVEKIRPVALQVWQARQVFGDGQIRSVAEQRKYLPAPRPARPVIIDNEPAIDEADEDKFERVTAGETMPVGKSVLTPTYRVPPAGIWLDLTADEIGRLKSFASAMDTDATGAVRRLMDMAELTFKMSGVLRGQSPAQ